MRLNGKITKTSNKQRLCFDVQFLKHPPKGSQTQRRKVSCSGCFPNILSLNDDSLSVHEGRISPPPPPINQHTPIHDCSCQSRKSLKSFSLAVTGLGAPMCRFLEGEPTMNEWMNRRMRFQEMDSLYIGSVPFMCTSKLLRRFLL